MSMDLREQKFGIEIELTGLTRKRAAEVIGKYLGQEPHYDGGYYEEYSVRDEQGRKWKAVMFMSWSERQNIQCLKSISLSGLH